MPFCWLLLRRIRTEVRWRQTWLRELYSKSIAGMLAFLVKQVLDGGSILKALIVANTIFVALSLGFYVQKRCECMEILSEFQGKKVSVQA